MSSMSVGVYFCNCGSSDEGQISSKIKPDGTVTRVGALAGVSYVSVVDFACSKRARSRWSPHLTEWAPDRVVIAACSPRQHEATFRSVLGRAGINPYLMQMVNIREQVAWVTEDPEAAVDKAVAQISAGVARVQHQEPLAARELAMSTDVLVIGGGPAGLKATLTLAEAGHRVTLVEKGPILGGLPVRYEEIFPAHGVCPVPAGAYPRRGSPRRPRGSHRHPPQLRGDRPQRFDRKLRRADPTGSPICLAHRLRRLRSLHRDLPGLGPEPARTGPDRAQGDRFRALRRPAECPVLDPTACLRFTAGDVCSLCQESCPVEGSMIYDDAETLVDRKVGAIIVAVGGGLYDLGKVSNLMYGGHPDVLSSWDVERMLAANGPTGGQLLTHGGKPPEVVAVVHCAGSLEPDHVPYCSGICCQSAFKYVHQIEQAKPDTNFVCFYKTIVTPGKEAFGAYQRAAADPNVSWVQYGRLADLDIDVAEEGPLVVTCRRNDGEEELTRVDLVILMAPLVPAASTPGLAQVLDVGVDSFGFLEELNARSDATRSNVRGIYIAGTCQSPMDIQASMTQGAAVSGNALSALVAGRKLVVDPMTAFVDAERCSGCRTCVPVCPYKAIDFDVDLKVAAVNSALCAGCGTCVAACPADAMQGRHFTSAAIVAEIEAVMTS